MNVCFRLPDGSVRRHEAFPGDSVMMLATRHGIPGIIGECGGEMTCATCHVYVGEGSSALFPPPSMEEDDLLEAVDDRREESRLSCQLRLAGFEEDIAVQVPSE